MVVFPFALCRLSGEIVAAEGFWWRWLCHSVARTEVGCCVGPKKSTNRRDGLVLPRRPLTRTACGKCVIGGTLGHSRHLCGKVAMKVSMVRPGYWSGSYGVVSRGFQTSRERFFDMKVEHNWIVAFHGRELRGCVW